MIQPVSTESPTLGIPKVTLSKSHLDDLDVAGRISLLRECCQQVIGHSREWVDAACQAKGIPDGSPSRAEEISTGPIATARFLRLLELTLRDIEEKGKPILPGSPRSNNFGKLEVPVIPEKRLYDSLVFTGFQAKAIMQSGINLENFDSSLAPQYRGGEKSTGRIALVLGAGNVSSIPATDSLSKIFLENCAVLLKMNPVNEYLGNIFEKSFSPLVNRGLLQIIYGGAEAGAAAIELPEVETVHITGSIEAHDAIVWGPSEGRNERIDSNSPVLKKVITSELGNVSPWIVVPGPYSEKELAFQAENIVSSITNNASFNCIATKVILTWKGWDQRDNFLGKIQSLLDRVPRRTAYYPGACDRYNQYAEEPAQLDSKGTLPWTLLTGLSTDAPEKYFQRESFVCVTVEVPLEAASEEEFLEKAVQFANEKTWGTLGVSLTVHPKFRKKGSNEDLFQKALADLKYGTVAINQWAGLAFAMMSLPWGGYPGQPLTDIQSGTGWVHNSYMLDGVEKSVMEGPLTIFPKPIWFPTHKNPEPVAWRLLELYDKPGIWNLLRLIKASIL
ncbi:MAG: aldehyde dehydrogenase family protein [Candidatus Omnitrophica bacterium]|nr:aldehyde dehydrogenase family protein [Candidatus Omnitrophota bacterium]